MAQPKYKCLPKYSLLTTSLLKTSSALSDLSIIFLHMRTFWTHFKWRKCFFQKELKIFALQIVLPIIYLIYCNDLAFWMFLSYFHVNILSALVLTLSFTINLFCSILPSNITFTLISFLPQSKDHWSLASVTFYSIQICIMFGLK